jgi:hypothetical protein
MHSIQVDLSAGKKRKISTAVGSDPQLPNRLVRSLVTIVTEILEM